MFDLFITIGFGAIGLYYIIKVYTGNCNQNRIGIENQNEVIVDDNIDDNEVPPKYEDIIAVNN